MALFGRGKRMGLQDAMKKIAANDPSCTTGRLYGREIDDTGAAALAEALKHNTTMTMLDLSGNEIGETGAAALGEALKHNQTLTTLVLSSNEIGETGAAALGEALKHNQTLSTLSLSDNNIGQTGAAALAEALKHNQILTTLELACNSLGDAGVAALAEAIQHNQTLTTLDLSWSSISDTAVAALAEALNHNCALTMLNVECRLTTEAQQELSNNKERNQTWQIKVDRLKRACTEAERTDVQVAAALYRVMQTRLAGASTPTGGSAAIKSDDTVFGTLITLLDTLITLLDTLIMLLDTWAERVGLLSGSADALRIASATQQLTRALSNSVKADTGSGLAQLDELEQATASAESAAQRFRQAHEALTEAVSLTLESAGNTLSADLVQERDAAFEQLREAVQQLEACGSRLDLNAVRAAASARLAPVADALNNMQRLTGIELASALEADIAADDSDDDARVVKEFDATLTRTAVGIAQHVEKANAFVEQVVNHFIERAERPMLDATANLQNEICAVMTLKSSSGSQSCDTSSLVTLLRYATPWAALLRCAARLIAPLRSVDDKIGCLQYRAAGLRSEVDAFAVGFANREQITSVLEEKHKAMKRARRAYKQLQKDDDSSDGDSDADAVNSEELARQRQLCRVATLSRDSAARDLFLAAKAYHPETLVQQQKRLRLTGLCSIWSDRTLNEYDERKPLARKTDSRHAMVRAKYDGELCILKIVQLQDGRALCKEAEVLRRLRHPNIVKLEAAFVHSGFLYLHFRYAKHGDLEQYLEVQASATPAARVSAAQLRRMARQLCEAVAYLAERNVVHCDIKPANVFVGEEGTVRGSAAPLAILGDFDVSHTASGRTATLTKALQTRGVATHYSAGCAAPEVVQAPNGCPPKATHKLDIFGLGCVIYHMHMYPRALPEARAIDDDVSSRAGLFDHSLPRNKAGPALLECAVAEWAKAVPRYVIVGATRANPVARLSARELLQTEYMRRADGEYARVAVQRPGYWQYQEHAGSWLVHEGADVVAQVEKLLNDTAKPEEHGTDRDSHDAHFDRFKVMSVQRVENSQIWAAYASRRHAGADALASEGYVLPEEAQRVATAGFQYPLEGGALEAAAGEVLLFHGTSRPEWIATSGFDVRYAYAGARAGAMFGRGVYFAESASKSDQYVSHSAGSGKLTLIIARVCLGRCKVVTNARGRAPFLPEVEGVSTPAVPIYYDSILTEVPGMRFREIVVGKDTSAYPELIIEYERV